MLCIKLPPFPHYMRLDVFVAM